MQIVNDTPFPADRLVVLDRQGAERLVVVVKATYAVSPQTAPRIADAQRPIAVVDAHRGEPGASSLLQETELGPPKPGTDVVLVGSARPASGRAQTVDVTFTLGALSKSARVVGDRTWDTVLGVLHLTPPRPFEAMPLAWENAFGGSDTSAPDPAHHEREPRNPVGKGFRARKSTASLAGTAAPNIEDPREPYKSAEQRLTPIGFGFIGRDWAPRLSYAGTYDDAWRESRMPLLPLDFDDRFHHAAPPDFVVPGRLAGGEPVTVSGCTPGGRLAFALPRPVIEVEAQFKEGREPVAMNLDTVVVDTDASEVRLLFKGDLEVHRRLLRLSEIRVRTPREG